MVPAIRVVDVSKRFSLHHEKSLKERLLSLGKHVPEDFWALSDVSFELEPAHTLGLIGANGSGKSTLLKLIGGILVPTAGYVERRGRLAALLELGAGFHGDLTGRENVYLNASILGLTRRQTAEYFDAIVEFSGIEQFIDTQVKFYSSGMYVRLAFAVAVHVDPEILLVDEVLSVGDEPFQRKCLDRIKQFQRDGRTIIFVTHGLDLARQLCDRVIMLDKGRVVIDGKPVDALREFRERFASDMQAEPDEFGTRQMEIVKTIVTDGHGNAKERFEPGDSLGIEIEVVARETIHDWVAGIAIFNHMDMLVFGTNTLLRSIELPPISGRRRVRFGFGEIPMVEGQYFVTIAVHNRKETVAYHRLERTTSFRVSTPAGEPGVVHMNVTCSVDEA